MYGSRSQDRKTASFAFALLWVVFNATTGARADVGVVIADPTTIGASAYTQAGHALVYLSGVCLVSPVRARLCEPGEQGSVVTAYPNFRETKPYAWNLAPLSIYLDGLPTPDDRLLYASHHVKTGLEDAARTSFLQPVCGDGQCPDAPHSYWRDIVATTADRDVFIYAVHSTRAQDQAIVDWLNVYPNVNHYHGMTNNCAVFTRSLVNAVFPHAVHRDFLNDLGMMSPKSAARSFSHWALKHPELGFYSLHFAQQPGDFPRSGLARSGTEAAIHIKKYLIAAAMIGDHEVAGSFFVAYFLTGRFGLEKEYRRYPKPSVVALETEANAAKKQDDQPRLQLLRTSMEEERAGQFGTPEDWESYRERFTAFQDFARTEGIPQGKKGNLPPEFATASVWVDSEGYPWLNIADSTATRRVGISSANLLSPDSDPRLAFELMLGRVAYVLRAKSHRQEDVIALRKDWSLLQATYDRLHTARPAGDWSVIAERR